MPGPISLWDLVPIFFFYKLKKIRILTDVNEGALFMRCFCVNFIDFEMNLMKDYLRISFEDRSIMRILLCSFFNHFFFVFTIF